MGRKETTVLIAIVVNLVLIGLKFLLADASGSLSLRASAWHSFSDVVVSAIVLVGLLLARRDRAAANGVSRVEHAVSLLVALFIFYVGFDVFRDALSGEEPELRNVFWVALAAVITIALSYFMARYKTYVGRATGSPALIADGYHSLMDMYSSVVVVAGLFGYAIGFRSLDRVAAVVVVLFIVFAGYEILRDALAGLSSGHTQHEALAEPRRLLRVAAPFLAVALLAMYALSGLYAVPPGQVGVVRRFGRLIDGAVQPGLHYRVPWPVDAVALVPVGAVQRAEVPRALMLTGDQNLVNVAATVHYRVRSATEFVFNVAAPADLLRAAAEASLRQTVGLRSVDALLTADRAAIQGEAELKLQARLYAAGSGLEVVAIQLTEVNPPPEVAPAFLDVASAREDRATYINEAMGYQNEILPKARGDAERALREAEGYRAEKIANSAGEAKRFASRLAEYKNAPVVTRTRLYLETVERVLVNVPKFLLSPELTSGGVDLWLTRGGAPTAPATGNPPGGASGSPPSPAPSLPSPPPPAPAAVPTPTRPPASGVSAPGASSGSLPIGPLPAPNRP